ncbi:hypothetical protein [Fibrella aquatilis]|uniref:Uncharacterized protein n=1 Tax=Fibrella aquatilis TaxID=2817059 RepID=A0A939G4H7_9BACT|nr:hypothetical protein [Fibrella aquatilis]MBO0930464.1 hypothetical protein [Fibrella aquatilis]
MNIAFGAVVIVALLYPGVLFRVLYVRGFDVKGIFGASATVPLGKGQIQFNRNVSKSKFRIFGQAIWEQVIASLLPAFFVHLLTIQLVSGFGHWRVSVPDYGLVYRILVADRLDAAAIEQVTDSLPRFIGYFLALLVVASSIGAVCRTVVKRYYIDLFIKLLRFSSDWDYLLSGRILGKAEKTLDVIWIHVLSETKEQSIIYDGFLWDYELSDNNGLDRIILFNVSKRFIHKEISGFKYQQSANFDSPLGEKFSNKEAFSYDESEEINEQLVVFPYGQLKNLTITYVDLAEVIPAS